MPSTLGGFRHPLLHCDEGYNEFYEEDYGDFDPDTETFEWEDDMLDVHGRKGGT